MRTYRVEFAGSLGASIVIMALITVLSLSIVGLPLAIAILPTLYRVVEEE